MAFFEYSFHVGMRDIGKNNEISNKAILSFFEDAGGLQGVCIWHFLNIAFMLVCVI